MRVCSVSCAACVRCAASHVHKLRSALVIVCCVTHVGYERTFPSCCAASDVTCTALRASLGPMPTASCPIVKVLQAWYSSQNGLSSPLCSRDSLTKSSQSASCCPCAALCPRLPCPASLLVLCLMLPSGSSSQPHTRELTSALPCLCHEGIDLPYRNTALCLCDLA